MADLHLWKIVPVAAWTDPAWQGRKPWREIVVVAGSSGQALLAATRFHEAQARSHDANSQDGQQARSGLADEKLYRVDRLSDLPGPDATEGDVVSFEQP